MFMGLLRSFLFSRSCDIIPLKVVSVMSDSFVPTNQQKRILKLIYRQDRTYSYLSRKLHVSVDTIRLLTGGKMVDFLHVSAPKELSSGYESCIVSIKLAGQAYIEHVIDHDRTRRKDTRHFWIGIFLGSLFDWLLSSLGTPRDLLHLLGIL